MTPKNTINIYSSNEDWSSSTLIFNGNQGHYVISMNVYTTKDFKDTRDSGSQGTKMSTHGHICSYIKEVLTLRAAKTPATATLAVPWMSSLKVQYLLRYFSRNLKAL